MVSIFETQTFFLFISPPVADKPITITAALTRVVTNTWVPAGLQERKIFGSIWVTSVHKRMFMHCCFQTGIGGRF